MEILVFENEYQILKNTFEYLNSKKFKGKLNYTYYPRSQDLESIEDLYQFDLLIIDIDLSTKSKLDGFGLIRLIEKQLKNDAPPILILTGQEIIEGYEKEQSLKQNYHILEKPIDFNELYEALNIVLDLESVDS